MFLRRRRLVNWIPMENRSKKGYFATCFSSQGPPALVSRLPTSLSSCSRRFFSAPPPPPPPPWASPNSSTTKNDKGNAHDPRRWSSPVDADGLAAVASVCEKSPPIPLTYSMSSSPPELLSVQSITTKETWSDNKTRYKSYRESKNKARDETIASLHPSQYPSQVLQSMRVIPTLFPATIEEIVNFGATAAPSVSEGKFAGLPPPASEEELFEIIDQFPNFFEIINLGKGDLRRPTSSTTSSKLPAMNTNDDRGEDDIASSVVYIRFVPYVASQVPQCLQRLFYLSADQAPDFYPPLVTQNRVPDQVAHRVARFLSCDTPKTLAELQTLVSTAKILSSSSSSSSSQNSSSSPNEEHKEITTGATNLVGGKLTQKQPQHFPLSHVLVSFPDLFYLTSINERKESDITVLFRFNTDFLQENRIFDDRLRTPKQWIGLSLDELCKMISVSDVKKNQKERFKNEDLFSFIRTRIYPNGHPLLDRRVLALLVYDSLPRDRAEGIDSLRSRLATINIPKQMFPIGSSMFLEFPELFTAWVEKSNSSVQRAYLPKPEAAANLDRHLSEIRTDVRNAVRALLHYTPHDVTQFERMEKYVDSVPLAIRHAIRDAWGGGNKSWVSKFFLSRPEDFEVVEADPSHGINKKLVRANMTSPLVREALLARQRSQK